MKITYGIQASPIRYTEYAKRLERDLYAEGIDHVDLCVDFFMIGCWGGAKKVWERTPADSTHRVLLQEDVILCKGFAEHVRRIVEAVPDKMISLYASPYFKDGVAWAKRNDYSFFKAVGGAAGQGLIMPIEMVRDFMAWQETNVKKGSRGDDVRYYGYMVETGQHCYVAVPSVIEHAAPMDSSVGYNHKGKVAVDFIGDREQDWSKIPPDGSWIFSKRGAVADAWYKRYAKSS